MDKIDFSRWEELVKSPTWYIGVVADTKPFLVLKEKDSSKWEEFKEQVYNFFEKHLKEKIFI